MTAAGYWNQSAAPFSAGRYSQTRSGRRADAKYISTFTAFPHTLALPTAIHAQNTLRQNSEPAVIYQIRRAIMLGKVGVFKGLPKLFV